jgi:hypothetical protein
MRASLISARAVTERFDHALRSPPVVVIENLLDPLGKLLQRAGDEVVQGVNHR